MAWTLAWTLVWGSALMLFAHRARAESLTQAVSCCVASLPVVSR